MKLSLAPAWSLLAGNKADLEAVYRELMFEDKQVKSELARFRKSCRWKEREQDLPAEYWTEKARREAELKAAIDVYATRWAGDDLAVPTGFAQRLSAFAEIEDLRPTDQNRRHHRAREVTLRNPQIEGLAAMQGSRFHNGLIRIATGVGKSTLAQEYIGQNGRRAVFAVPSEPILNQMVARFEDAFGKREVGWYYGGGKRHGYVTVATYQSINAADPSEFDDYDIVIGDECHHVGADTFYEAMMNRIRNATYRFGLSADEERSDGGTILVEAAIGPCIYEYPAWLAIEQNYLARPMFVTYNVTSTGGTYKEWKTKGTKRECVGTKDAKPYAGTDSGIAYKNWVLGNDRLNEFVTQAAREMAASGQSILILVDEKEHGEKICAGLGEEFVDYGFCVGGGKNNETLLKAFNKRVLKILVATTTLSEGADTIPVDVLFNFLGGIRPKQAVGRALRNEVVDGVIRKPTSTVVDFNFPDSDPLSRHYEMRAEVYRSYRCGDPIVMGSI
jgi:superfamily II DNA or RNA helicase